MGERATVLREIHSWVPPRPNSAHPTRLGFGTEVSGRLVSARLPRPTYWMNSIAPPGRR